MKHLYILLLIMVSLILFSCEDLLVKELDLEEFDYESQLVLSSSVNNLTEEVIVYVSENSAITSTYSDPEESTITDANVRLMKGSELVGNLEYFSDGIVYVLELDSPLDEGDYSLEVSAPGFPDAIGSSVIPTSVPLKEIEYIEDAGIHPNTLERSDALKITFDDPDGQNYYGLNVLSGELGTIIDTFIYNMDTTIYEYQPFVDVASNDPDVFIFNGGFLLPDDFFDGREKSLTLFIDVYDLDISENKEAFVVSWENLSEEKYLFERSIDLYQSSSGFGPFSEPVSVYTNVENGLGYFAGSHIAFYDLP